MQPHIPVKKSKKQIKSYLKHGKEFGKILFQIYETLQDNILKTSRDIELYFKELAEHYDPTVDYPFRDQVNQQGKRYKAPICVSINDAVAHCRPKSTTKLKKNDIISVDCGLKINGLMYDSAFTVADNSEQPDWIKAPHHTLRRIGAHTKLTNTSNISKIIQNTAENYYLDIVTALAGHGIGTSLHEAPQIHNAMGNFASIDLFEGLVFCVEPIYTYSGLLDTKQSPVYIDSDGWTIKTVNKQPSTHWETMFAVIDNRLVDLIGITKWEI